MKVTWMLKNSSGSVFMCCPVPIYYYKIAFFTDQVHIKHDRLAGKGAPKTSLSLSQFWLQTAHPHACFFLYELLWSTPVLYTCRYKHFTDRAGFLPLLKSSSSSCHDPSSCISLIHLPGHLVPIIFSVFHLS